MLHKTGIPSIEQVKGQFPEESTLSKPKAIIECYEDIPCNPCETSCPFQAISIGPDINQQPKVDFDKCTGCTICVTSCPGLAIIVAEVHHPHAIIKIPYEFLPRPQKGEVWHAVNRSGEIVGDANILQTLVSRRQDRTLLVSIEIDSSLVYEVITIRRKHA
jgi:Fe-S-cluster-containing hydrogenase component 2